MGLLEYIMTIKSNKIESWNLKNILKKTNSDLENFACSIGAKKRFRIFEDITITNIEKSDQ